MEFNEYQKQAQETAKYRGKAEGDIGYAVHGIVVHAGKLSKAAQHQKMERTVDTVLAKRAIGAIVWYAQDMAAQLGLSFEAVAQGNLADIASHEFTPLPDDLK